MIFDDYCTQQWRRAQEEAGVQPHVAVRTSFDIFMAVE
jgi:hypothetical protein